jgi:hypothetical protein
MFGDLEVENVVVFVGDAVRWDATSDELSRRGLTFKTVSASLHTPTSFTTMLSGLHPCQHQVYGFQQQLTGADSVFDLPAHDVFFGPGYMNDWLCNQQQILGSRPQSPLTDVESPFVWISRDGGAHAPYDGFDEAGQAYADVDAREYLMDAAGDERRLRREYDNAVGSFLDRVDSMLDLLDERGLANETLVIVTSDHGELLGEYGQIGHDFPAVPELVYVPTTFIHPQIEGGRVREGVARHVDLLPTIVDTLGYGQWSTPGVSLLTERPTRGVSHYNRSFSDFLRVGLRETLPLGLDVPLPNLRLDLVGVWDREGGIVFNRSARLQQLGVIALRLLGTPEGRHVVRTRSFKELYANAAFDVRRYGDPSISEAAARSELNAYEASDGLETVVRERELDRTSVEQLEDLGYL